MPLRGKNGIPFSIYLLVPSKLGWVAWGRGAFLLGVVLNNYLYRKLVRRFAQNKIDIRNVKNDHFAVTFFYASFKAVRFKFFLIF